MLAHLVQAALLEKDRALAGTLILRNAAASTLECFEIRSGNASRYAVTVYSSESFPFQEVGADFLLKYNGR